MQIEKIVEVLGGEENIGRNVHGRGDYIRAFRKGNISSRVVGRLQRRMGVTNTTMAHILNISDSTLQRLKKAEDSELGKAETDTLYEVSKVIAKGMDVYEDEDALNRWLNRENQALGYERPVDLLDSAIGREQVMNVLNAIEHGFFS